MSGSSPLLAQIRRMLSLERVPSDDAHARTLISAQTPVVAAALFAEAAASDDVTSAATARDYLADRLATLAPLLTQESAATIRAAFEANLKAWE